LPEFETHFEEVAASFARRQSMVRNELIKKISANVAIMQTQTEDGRNECRRTKLVSSSNKESMDLVRSDRLP